MESPPCAMLSRGPSYTASYRQESHLGQELPSSEVREADVNAVIGSAREDVLHCERTRLGVELKLDVERSRILFFRRRLLPLRCLFGQRETSAAVRKAWLGQPPTDSRLCAGSPQSPIRPHAGQYNEDVLSRATSWLSESERRVSFDSSTSKALAGCPSLYGHGEYFPDKQQGYRNDGA